MARMIPPLLTERLTLVVRLRDDREGLACRTPLDAKVKLPMDQLPEGTATAFTSDQNVNICTRNR